MGGRHYEVLKLRYDNADANSVAPLVPKRQEMVNAKIPLHYRDTCAGLLIPLNECRRTTFFLPWKCQDLRHAYEKCQYEEWKSRVKLLKNKN
ncbi:hypothetical protein CCR75_008845 [Bremia lactucae]|uniref:NADH dehydrogenase [ubiquinone] 1 beta subcomplex subunit 7 n=1 Tax=Bremia lactucae TaxID=4779 RepID=A0A976IKX4_BRELC|nr:hypothetical protein CCR75_008845 [Bremia lactucae]